MKLILLILIFCTALSACGQKGALFRPPTDNEPTTSQHKDA